MDAFVLRGRVLVLCSSLTLMTGCGGSSTGVKGDDAGTGGQGYGGVGVGGGYAVTTGGYGNWYGIGGTTNGTGGYVDPYAGLGGSAGYTETGGVSAGGAFFGTGGVGGEGIGGAVGVGGGGGHGYQQSYSVCQDELDACHAQLDTICDALGSVECGKRRTKCDDSYAPCFEQWQAACPTASVDCFEGVGTCYDSDEPYGVCDDMLRLCNDISARCEESLPDYPAP